MKYLILCMLTCFSVFATPSAVEDDGLIFVTPQSIIITDDGILISMDNEWINVPALFHINNNIFVAYPPNVGKYIPKYDGDRYSD